MAISVSINGQSYSIPEQGQNAPWGSDLTALVNALVSVANNTTGTADILTTSFTLANNQVATANVTGAAFDTSTVRSAVIQYSIYRSSATPTELSECGHIYLTYKTTAGTWELAQSYAGSSGVTFSITNAGQLQYVSTDIGATSYTGKMKFLAKSFLQA